MEEIYQLVHYWTQKERERIRILRAKVQLENIFVGDYVLVSMEDFFEGEKLCLRLRGPRRVIKVLSYYICRVEDLRTGDYEDDTDPSKILSWRQPRREGYHVACSGVRDKHSGWSTAPSSSSRRQSLRGCALEGLTGSEDTLEPLSRVYEDVIKLTRSC